MFHSSLLLKFLANFCLWKTKYVLVSYCHICMLFKPWVLLVRSNEGGGEGELVFVDWGSCLLIELSWVRCSKKKKKSELKREIFSPCKNVNPLWERILFDKTLKAKRLSSKLCLQEPFHWQACNEANVMSLEAWSHKLVVHCMIFSDVTEIVMKPS